MHLIKLRYGPRRHELRDNALITTIGTNYGFSAWAPQFAEKLHLSATQTNLIGNFGNLGMYAMGIPGGMLIDSRGPRWGVSMGSVCLGLGYFLLKRAFDAGPGEASMAIMCFASLLTGVGSCTSFSAAIKVCATNWPKHRGTATGLPLGAFGLSAFFYTAIAAALFPNDASGYLKLLGFGTTIMTLVGMLFLSIVPAGSDQKYAAVPRKREESPDRAFSRNASSNSSIRSHAGSPKRGRNISGRSGVNTPELIREETASLLDTSGSSTPMPGDIDAAYHSSSELSRNRSHPRPELKQEITGWALVRTVKFWQFFLMLALLAGVGLMTINNIGNNARALWHFFDDSASKKFIQGRQMLHVSILSVFSFLGRLLSGIGSDFLLHRGFSRMWTLVASSGVFLIAQIFALTIQDPNYLFILSSLSGLAYGMLFGVYPALIADAFGPSGMGINWGCMTLAPVISANAFNLIYGSILDAHSKVDYDEDGHLERTCDEGLACYHNAYWVTLVASICAVGWSLWCVTREEAQSRREKERWERREHEP
jgi:MFS family permease